ncbi:MAG: glycosyltransferase [Patescibacteria group bacterium]|nr:glycosyltransferase [Patescibacteria group bacterium]
MTKLRILILHTSVGLGHKVIAQNIAASLPPEMFEVKLADVYQIQDGRLIRTGAKLHRFMNVQAPWLWRFFYNSRLFTNLSLRFRLKVAAKNYGQVWNVVQEFQPDMIIATQTSASAVVAFLKANRLFMGQFGIAFSDFHLHRYWLYEQADFYIANVQEQKEQMKALGIGSEKIFVCGFSSPPVPAVDRAQVMAGLKIGSEKKVVLVANGSLGYGLHAQLLDQLASRPDWHLVVVCGKNQEAFEILRRQFSGRLNVTVLGFYQPMSELYAIADIFLTKPGGLSVVEALAFNLPMIITGILPGQEEWNLRFLLKQRLVMSAAKDLLGQVAEEFRTGQFQRQLTLNPARQSLLGAPAAGKFITELLLR